MNHCSGILGRQCTCGAWHVTPSAPTEFVDTGADPFYAEPAGSWAVVWFFVACFALMGAAYYFR
jgi:hypothetical protein